MNHFAGISLSSIFEWFELLSPADKIACFNCSMTCLLVLTGIGGFIFVSRQIKEAKHAFGQNQKELATKDFLRHLYDQRQITIYDEGANSQPLRSARTWALKQYEADQWKWRLDVCDMPRKVVEGGKELTIYTRQNQIAYHTAEITQDLGLACFSGTIPLYYILASNADAVLDDWLICASWVKDYRKHQKVSARDQSNIPFHRRHGEWIASVCYLYMKGTWTYQWKCEQFLKEYQLVNGKVSTPEKFVRELCKLEPDLIDDDTKRVVDKVIRRSQPCMFKCLWSAIHKKSRHLMLAIKRGSLPHSLRT